MRRTARSLAVILTAAWLAGPAQAARSLADARRQAEAAEVAKQAALEAQKQAEQRAAEARVTLAGLAARRTHALARLRGAELRTLDAADRMAGLDRAERDARSALAARAAEIAPLLPLIERLSLYPSETLLAVPAAPDDAVRGLIVLQGITHRLEQEAAALKQDEARLAEARAAIAAQSPVLAQARTAQEQAAEELDSEIAAAELSRDTAELQAEQEAARAADLAARSTTLHALLDRLEAARRADKARVLRDAVREAAKAKREAAATKPSPVRTEAAGILLVPVAGSVVRNWGAPTEAGPAEGISYRAAPNARVVAPCGGRVAFAAPFRSYGKLLILSCGGGINAVLAGFASLHVHPGQSVRRGDPVGSMPDWSPASSASRPTLYVELRRDGDPVNPGPLLGTS